MIEFFQGFCGCKAFEKNIYEDQFIDNLLKNNGNTTKSKPLNEKIFTIGYGIFFCHLMPKGACLTAKSFPIVNVFF